ncbi:glycosyltransferase family 4 protein [Pedobacter sp. MC2016-15]|uniref:glycosyltransferase family 4 protein n=1 Tax=Pedobacter sp. MC2016-15 TaxID=2994473 RepID=UPI00224745B9|nr:glycosyltransferase family 4 protein [Pedobacter sp. MC2016-15]MCX2477773.1 glycosyltransferase family 4 protein [Pedobacter sp. MC2016-15]
MHKIKLIEAGNELGLGGTEYAIQLYSKYLNKEYFDVTVVALREGGPRRELIGKLGLRVVVLDGDLNKLATMLQETDVFHWHGYGTLDQDLFEVIRDNKPKLVLQTNVFGAYKHTKLYNVIDYDLYISKMILVRRMFYDQHLPDNFAYKRKVLSYPIDIPEIERLRPSDWELQRFKRQHGLQGLFIVGRIGRADNAKFDLITLDAFAAFAENVKEAQFLLVGCTPEILFYVNQLGIQDKMLILENTADLEKLLYYYHSMDIFLAASEFGESFGMVIAESMVSGIPVVTISTPHKDNAQIELVDNGTTGLVVERSITKIADALLFLYQHQDLRSAFSAASKRKVEEAYRASRIVKSLENLIFDHLRIPLLNSGGSLLTDYSQEMVDEYISRLHNLWQPEIQL